MTGLSAKGEHCDRTKSRRCSSPHHISRGSHFSRNSAEERSEPEFDPSLRDVTSTSALLSDGVSVPLVMGDSLLSDRRRTPVMGGSWRAIALLRTPLRRRIGSGVRVIPFPSTASFYTITSSQRATIIAPVIIFTSPVYL